MFAFLAVSTAIGCKIKATQFGGAQAPATPEVAQQSQNSAFAGQNSRPAIAADDFEAVKKYLNTDGAKAIEETLEKSTNEIYDITLLQSKNLENIEFMGHKIENFAQWLPSLETYFDDVAKMYPTYKNYLEQFSDARVTSVESMPSDEDLAFIIDLINQGPDAVEQLDKSSDSDFSGLFLGSARECANAILGALGDVANLTIGCTGVGGAVEAVASGSVKAGATAVTKLGVGMASGAAQKGTEHRDQDHDPYYDAARALPCVGGAVGAPKSIGHAIGENGCGRHTHRGHSKPGQKKTLKEIFTE